MGTTSDLMLRARLRYWAPLRANRHASFNLSHSQFGEDMVLRGIFGDRRRGVYVDVGAHHPVYLSNTYHFYCKGWRGLNVDAMPGSMRAFRTLRPGDQNVEACVGPVAGQTVDYFEFDQPAYNTLDRLAAEDIRRDGRAKLLSKRSLVTQTLADVLDRNLPGRAIDLLSIDIEGGDEAVLRSNDWDRLRPEVLVFERGGLDLAATAADPFMRFLADVGYFVEAKCGPSFILRRPTN